MLFGIVFVGSAQCTMVAWLSRLSTLPSVIHCVYMLPALYGLSCVLNVSDVSAFSWPGLVIFAV
jgi:hypothetical protein